MGYVLIVIICLLIAFVPAIAISILIIRAICNYLAKRIAIEIRKEYDQIVRDQQNYHQQIYNQQQG